MYYYFNRSKKLKNVTSLPQFFFYLSPLSFLFPFPYFWSPLPHIFFSFHVILFSFHLDLLFFTSIILSSFHLSISFFYFIFLFISPSVLFLPFLSSFPPIFFLFSCSSVPLLFCIIPIIFFCHSLLIFLSSLRLTVQDGLVRIQVLFTSLAWRNRFCFQKYSLNCCSFFSVG